jgi:hypothetical protein
MRLKVERLPNAMDGRGRKSDRARHRAQAPMRRIPRRRIQRQANRLGDLVIADPARRAGARLVEEAIEACAPNRRRHLPTVLGAASTRRLMSLLSAPSAAKRTMRARCASPCAVFRRDAKTLKLTPLPLRQIDRNRRLAHRQSSAESIHKENRTYLPITTLAPFALGSGRAGGIAHVLALEALDRGYVYGRHYLWRVCRRNQGARNSESPTGAPM